MARPRLATRVSRPHLSADASASFVVTAGVAPRLSAALADRYRVDRELGAGGMATVYLAHDLKHDRDVAIKVLHPDLGAALGAERFLSEIRTTARLQHPHILPLLDSGDAGGLLYYVMPVVTGETLRARLEREHQLPIPEAVRIAGEVASALDYAHRQQVIHRDIKPENILLHDGQALVADFGIALAVQTAGGQRMTQTGLSLGTPQYMSPEQAMGEKHVDARSDIYALGAVTYEMLAGDPPFTGSSVQAIVAKVVNERPTPLSTLRDTVPPGVEHAVLTALAKLPADRFATAAEFAAALGDTSGVRAVGASHSSGADARVALLRRLSIILGAAALVAAMAAVWGWTRASSPSAQQVTRVSLALPASQWPQPQYFGRCIALSPDGSRLAYVGPSEMAGAGQVWIRSLDALEASPVPGTSEALSVEWSPDGRSLLVARGLTTQRNVVVSMVGGQSVALPSSMMLSWGERNELFSVFKSAVLRVSLTGKVDTLVHGDTNFFTHSLNLLPDGSGGVYSRRPATNSATVSTELVLVSFASGEVTVIGPGIFGQVLADGRLLYVAADGQAFVAPFSTRSRRVTGPSTPVARVAVGSNSGRTYPQISASNNGSLVYLSGNLIRQRMAWLRPDGTVDRHLAIEGDIWGVSLSPDATRLAFSLRRDDRDPGSSARGTGDVWVEDLRTGARTRLTTTDFNVRPSWSNDGGFVLYTRVGGAEAQALFERRADASEPERLVLSQKTFGHSLGDGRWLPDHRTLVLRTYQDGNLGRNLYAMAPGVDTAPRPIAVTAAEETGPVPSPDGSLLAFNSDESGRLELYVQPFPTGARVAVSTNGATSGRWSRDGRQLYFWSAHGALTVATIQARPSLAVTGVREIATDFAFSNGMGLTDALFDVAPDGRILAAEADKSGFEIVLVRNWTAGLGKEKKP